MMLPTFADIEAAAQRIAAVAFVTPLIENAALNAAAGGRVLIKPEMLQRTGSFKIRGASNAIAQLSAEQRSRGVIAYSSGNHAQGVALAAARNNCSAMILMPSDAPKLKIARTRSFGAEIVFYDRARDDRYAMIERLVAETSRVLIAPFDDPQVIAGQGTVGLEIARQAAALNVTLDYALVPCSGGGLIGGTALALRSLSPQTEILAVEPEAFDDTIRSLAAGRRLDNEPGGISICDAVQSRLGELTFELNRKLLAGGVTVSDDEVRHAMAFAFNELKLVVEPGGCIALAAVLSGKLDLREKTAAIVLSGGNVDATHFFGLIGGIA